VGVVLGEGADPQQAVYKTPSRPAGDLAELRHPQRQLTVGMALGGKDGQAPGQFIGRIAYWRS